MGNEPKTSVLTEPQRKSLKLDFADESDSGERVKKKRIRERTRQALRDFLLLAENLEPEERQKIFDAEPRSDEFMELEEDVTATLFFLYTGMGGESQFRRPLRRAASKGENALGNVNYSLGVAPKFHVEMPYSREHEEHKKVVDIVEDEEWSKLESPELFAFIREATSANAIDFRAIRQRMKSRRRWMEQIAEFNSNTD